MAKEPDKTAEDVKQDAKATDLETRVKRLENEIQVLAPLAELLGSITQIRRHFGGV